MEPLISSLPWLRLRKVEDSINMIFGRGRPLLSGLARGFSVDHPKTTFGGCGLFSELLPNSCRDVSVKQNNCTEAHMLVELDNYQRDHPHSTLRFRVRSTEDFPPSLWLRWLEQRDL
ncbi:hypothetical protein CISG_03736 [Coccidioides immitis RMSCC 3703]|uniref:Uncharacterized protein n=1 Tax=Coccidioides immitis RMSCC 3703 TaxID=454286 RepID=A0A0J8QMK6_COCIT|nr:hypothetical protein CISG_03736 [Coccidioides immitis RMSCC 3703]